MKENIKDFHLQTLVNLSLPIFLLSSILPFLPPNIPKPETASRGLSTESVS